MRSVVFLDRDGVLNHDPGDYTRSLEEFTLLPTVMAALKRLAERGFEFVVITNQGGIAKGEYTHADVAQIHTYVRNRCVENHTPLLDIYYSPHHSIISNSLSRKPGSLMIERACARYGIDPATSWMVGDKERDLECGAGAGVQGILIPVNADLADYVDVMLAKLSMNDQ